MTRPNKASQPREDTPNQYKHESVLYQHEKVGRSDLPDRVLATCRRGKPNGSENRPKQSRPRLYGDLIPRGDVVRPPNDPSTSSRDVSRDFMEGRTGNLIGMNLR